MDAIQAIVTQRIQDQKTASQEMTEKNKLSEAKLLLAQGIITQTDYAEVKESVIRGLRIQNNVAKIRKISKLSGFLKPNRSHNVGASSTIDSSQSSGKTP